MGQIFSACKDPLWDYFAIQKRSQFVRNAPNYDLGNFALVSTLTQDGATCVVYYFETP